MGRKPTLKSERNPDLQLNSRMEEEDILHYMGKSYKKQGERNGVEGN